MFNALFPVVRNICNNNSNGFNVEASSTVYSQGDEIKRSQIRFYKIGNKSRHLSIIIEVKLLGEQVVSHLNIDGERTEITRSSTNVDVENILINNELIEGVILSALVNFTAIT